MMIADQSYNEAKKENEILLSKGPRIGVRHVQTFLMFLLLAVGYAMRVNLSVGIVAMTTTNSSSNPDIPVYDWDSTGILLSSFYIGYITLQILAGELGKRFGVKWFLAVAMLINSVACALTPIMVNKLGVLGLILIRIIQGIFQGFFFPSVTNMLGKWAPKEERSTLGNLIFAGVSFGTIFAMPVTGKIAETWYGWPLAFYVFAGIGICWCLLWILLGSNNPSVHPYISIEEKLYIQASLQTDNTTDGKILPSATPWKAIFSSMPVWAIVVANFGQNWGYAALLTEISTYLSKVAHQEIGKNSILSAAPYMALFIVALVFGPLTDYIVAKKWFSRGRARKLMNSIGTLCPAIALTILGFISVDNNVVTIEILLIIAVGFNGAICCGFQVNHVDLSPKFAGILMGIANGSSNIISIISPLVVDIIVTDKTDPTQWRWVFILAAIMYIISDIFYCIYAEGERQWWDDSINEDEKERNFATTNSIKFSATINEDTTKKIINNKT